MRLRKEWFSGIFWTERSSPTPRTGKKPMVLEIASMPIHSPTNLKSSMSSPERGESSIGKDSPMLSILKMRSLTPGSTAADEKTDRPIRKPIPPSPPGPQISEYPRNKNQPVARDQALQRRRVH